MVKLSRKKENRERLYRNLISSLILHEKIITTDAKVKAIKSQIIKILNLAEKNDLAARRKALAYLYEKNIYHKLFEDIRVRLIHKSNPANLKIVRLKNRLGDNAPISVVKLELKPLEEIIKEEAKNDK